MHAVENVSRGHILGIAEAITHKPEVYSYSAIVISQTAEVLMIKKEEFIRQLQSLNLVWKGFQKLAENNGYFKEKEIGNMQVSNLKLMEKMHNEHQCSDKTKVQALLSDIQKYKDAKNPMSEVDIDQNAYNQLQSQYEISNNLSLQAKSMRRGIYDASDQVISVSDRNHPVIQIEIP